MIFYLIKKTEKLEATLFSVTSDKNACQTCLFNLFIIGEIQKLFRIFRDTKTFNYLRNDSNDKTSSKAFTTINNFEDKICYFLLSTPMLEKLKTHHQASCFSLMFTFSSKSPQLLFHCNRNSRRDYCESCC